MFKEAVNTNHKIIKETIIVTCLISKINNTVIRLINLCNRKITITNKITTVIDNNRNTITTKTKDNSILVIRNKKLLNK